MPHSNTNFYPVIFLDLFLIVNLKYTNIDSVEHTLLTCFLLSDSVVLGAGIRTIEFRLRVGVGGLFGLPFLSSLLLFLNTSCSAVLYTDIKINFSHFLTHFRHDLHTIHNTIYCVIMSHYAHYHTISCVLCLYIVCMYSVCGTHNTISCVRLCDYHV